jgi:small basic protein (TIGR04137 family)
MTLDKSLKVRAGAIKSRNVMTRAERIKRLQDLDKWFDDSIVLGMAKVRVPKISLKKKKKVKKEEDGDDKKKKKK